MQNRVNLLKRIYQKDVLRRESVATLGGRGLAPKLLIVKSRYAAGRVR